MFHRARTASGAAQDVPPRAAAGVLFLLVAAFVFTAGNVEAQRVRDDLYVTDGPVFATALSDNTLYIGGYFFQVGPATGGGVPLDAVSGTPVNGFPKVTGQVHAVVADGSGGWFIGGAFTAVGGVPRSNLAHIRSDNTVSPWNPQADYLVEALALSGSTVYAGGWFTSVGGQTRNFIAAIDAVTGLATAWNPDADGRVLALAVSGNLLFAAGDFHMIGGQERHYLASLNTSTGVGTSWDPQPSNEVAALAVSGDTVYAGGPFGEIGGQSRSGIAALDAATGTATSWNPTADGSVSVLAVHGGTVYAAGEFSEIGGQSRSGIAALDAATGAATSWAPQPLDGPVKALAVTGNAVYAGGAFTFIGGQVRANIAALDATTGAATSWNPNANNTVLALAVSGSKLYAGGDFNTMGGQRRNRIAALDTKTGTVTAWNPDASLAGEPSSGNVLALAVRGTTVYAGGLFSRIGGQERFGLAALDATTGAATPWYPDNSFIRFVNAIAVSGDTVYISGDFSGIGGQSRNHFAALDATTAAVTAWNPNSDYGGFTLVVSGNTVYVGGYDFASIGGAPRNGIAALDATTGQATSWNPGAVRANGGSGGVTAIAVGDGLVYVGGSFISIGGQERNNLAALDATTGLATEWNPGASGPSFALAVSGSTVYAGGWFTSIGGQERNNLAALDATTGSATAWNPNPRFDLYAGVSALTVSGSTVYAGGGFSSIGGLPHSGIAAIEAFIDEPPDCSLAAPTVARLWPPDHRLVPVEITGVTDSDGDPVAIRVSDVTQDEPVGVTKKADDLATWLGHRAGGGPAARGDSTPRDEDHCADAVMGGDGAVSLRSERLGEGNGRVYVVSFEATDGRGGTCEGTVRVCAPHDQGGSACVDDGQTVDSLGPCGSDRGTSRARGDSLRVGSGTGEP